MNIWKYGFDMESFIVCLIHKKQLDGSKINWNQNEIILSHAVLCKKDFYHRRLPVSSTQFRFVEIYFMHQANDRERDTNCLASNLFFTIVVYMFVPLHSVEYHFLDPDNDRERREKKNIYPSISQDPPSLSPFLNGFFTLSKIMGTTQCP